MDELKKAREKIDRIDTEIRKLFEKRMRTVEAVAEYKQAHGLPVFDPGREKIILDRASKETDSALSGYYREFLQALMDVSKHYQRDLLGQPVDAASEAAADGGSEAAGCGEASGSGSEAAGCIEAADNEEEA